MTVEEVQRQLGATEVAVRELQQELAQTNRGVAAVILELEQRLDERKAKLTATETTIHALQEELTETSRGLVALNLELEQRVDARTAELRQLNLELEARVQERTTQLREANDNLQNFAHSAAHDLRSPLRAIASFSAMALEDHGEKLGPDGQSLLQRVTQAAAQMRQLLDDLLEYSKIGQADLELKSVRLQDAVRDCLGLLESDIRARNAVVTVQEPLPDIIGHPATVMLLIHNYVSNALKFVSPVVQPKVRIAAEVREQEQKAETRGPESKDSGRPRSTSSPRADTRPAAPVVRLWVEDNGIGIEPEGLGKLFGVFQRLNSKSDYPGTGLGLAIVRKGAERMGGAAGVESTPGQGSRFWFELPQAPAAQAGA